MDGFFLFWGVIIFVGLIYIVAFDLAAQHRPDLALEARLEAERQYRAKRARFPVDPRRWDDD